MITLSFPKILCKVQMHLLIPHKWIFLISVSSPTFPVWIPLRSKLPVWTSPLWQYQHMCLHINVSLSFWLSVHVPQGSFRCFAWRAVWFWQVPYSPVYMAWIEHKVNMSSLMVGQTTRQSTFLHSVAGLNQELNFNTVAYEAFASRAWFPFSLVF